MGIKRRLLNFFLKLPVAVKTPLLRNIVSYPSEISGSLRFKVAETQEELTQAFQLLHDAYVYENLMTPQPSGLRVTKYHTLPSTTTLVAIENDVVVGTVSLIRHSSFGLPLEAIFEMKDVPAGSRLAEVSSLAIRKDRLHQKGRILFPLLKYLYHYSHDYFGVSHFVIAVNPKWFDFYRSILMFKPLSKKVVENYSFVNGAPAVGGILDLHRAQVLYKEIYGKKKRSRNLSAFFQELECTNMEFPIRKKGVITDPVLSPDLFEHFFTRVTDVMKSMTDRDLAILRLIYNHEAYSRYIPLPKVIPFKKHQNRKRFETHFEAVCENSKQDLSELVIQNVSSTGLGGLMKVPGPMPTGLQKIWVNIEEDQPCEVKGLFTWLEPNGCFGFEISESDAKWKEFISTLDERLIRLPSSAS